MKILELYVENVKRIEAVDITPAGNTVVIEGKNAQGKTSVLDAIAYALGGKSLIPEKPIREGAKTAEVRVDIGDYLITRKWSAGGNSTIKVVSKAAGSEGDVKSSPQAWLDGILGDLSFDPLRFTLMDRAHRVATLKSAAGLDFSVIDDMRARAEVVRRDAGRDVKRLEAELAGMPAEGADGEPEPRPLDDIMADMRKVNDLTRIRGDLERLSREHREAMERANALSESIKAAMSEIAEIEKTLDDRANAVFLQAELTAAQHHIAVAAVSRRRGEVEFALEAARVEYDKADGVIREQDAKKARMLSEAKIPGVAGLEIRDDEVYVEGIQFSEISLSQKIRVAMGIAMAQNPGLRVIRILDGSLLDSDSMAEIEKMAVENDFQVWIERVADAKTRGDAVFIEEGRVKE